MACFLVPVTEAIVTTVAQKILKKSENNKVTDNSKISFSEHLSRLNKMLWGGSGLLAFEHLWHGEISPFFPFLTAANDPEDTVEMLHEMATSGSAMAVLVTVVWIGTVIVSNKLVAQKAGAAV